MKTLTLRAMGLAAALGLAASAPLSAQFEKYVALGDSLTAGFQANCLVARNQRASYPAVIAHQLAIADFQQPLVQELALTSPLVGTPCLGAVFVPPSTITVGAVSQMGAPLNSLLGRPYDNLGLPGAHVDDLVDLTAANPNGDTADRFAALVLRNVPGSPFAGLNAVTEANILAPDLITLWIGSNDVLPAALTGLALVGVTITPLPLFEAKYDEVLASVAGSGRTLVLANLPNVTAIPFTTRVPAFITIPGGRVGVLGPGNDAYPCTPVPPDHGCSVPEGTLVMLPASSLLAQGIGVPVALGGTGQPLPDGRFVPPAMVEAGVLLYPDEVATINLYVNDYNAVIASRASDFGPLVDIHSIFDDINADGYHVGGLTLTSAFLSGGIFSADGFHPTPIGHAIIADEFIKVMNAELGTDIPRPDFSTVLFTPNVPNVGAGLTDGGPYDYSISTWQTLLATVPPARGVAVRFPSSAAQAPREGGRGTRTVTRGQGD